MTIAKYPFVGGILLAAPLVFTSYDEAQAATYNIDPTSSFVSLEVARDATTLTGNWTGQAADPLILLPIPGIDPKYGESGTYTVKIPEVCQGSGCEVQSTVSTSQLSGALLTTQTPDNLNFVFASTQLVQPDNMSGNLGVSISSTAPFSIQYQETGDWLAEWLPRGVTVPIERYPSRNNIFDAIKENLGEVLNYGFVYDLPLNGQAPIGNYDATPGSAGISFNLTGKNVDLGPASLQTESDGKKTATSVLKMEDLQKEFLIGGALEFTDFGANGLDRYGISLSDIANPDTVTGSWMGAYVAGEDEDIIRLTFNYEYALESTIEEFHKSRTCLESELLGELCKGSLLYEQWDISSPTGTITTRFKMSGQLFATGAGTYCDQYDCPEPETPPAVPLPAGGILLLSGLGGIVALKRRKKRAA